MGKARRRAYTHEERIGVAESICGMYKLGHEIVACCKACNLSARSFYNWLAKYPEINDLYKATLKEINKSNLDFYVSAARIALFENLTGQSKDIKTVTIQETVKVTERGVIKYVPVEKTITEITKKAASMAAVRIALEMFDPDYKNKDAGGDDGELKTNEFIERRNKFLEEKLKEMEEMRKKKD